MFRHTLSLHLQFKRRYIGMVILALVAAVCLTGSAGAGTSFHCTSSGGCYDIPVADSVYAIQGDGSANQSTNCGPASVVMAVRHATGQYSDLSPETARSKMGAAAGAKLSTDYIVAGLKAYKIAYQMIGSFSELEKAITERHNPVITLLIMDRVSGSSDYYPIKITKAQPCPVKGMCKIESRPWYTWDGNSYFTYQWNRKRPADIDSGRYNPYLDGHWLLLKGEVWHFGPRFLAFDPDVFSGNNFYYYEDGTPKGKNRSYYAAEIQAAFEAAGSQAIEITGVMPASLMGELAISFPVEPSLPLAFVLNDQATFVRHVNYGPPISLTPGEGIVKTWHIRNSGSSTFSNGYGITQTGGPSLDLVGPAHLTYDLAPGQETDVSVAFMAPYTSGSYSTQWRMLDAQGVPFGDVLPFDFSIQGSSTDIPTVIPPTNINGAEFCDGTNYGAPCVSFVYTSNDTCFNMASYGWDNRAESLRFRGNYSSNYEVVAYDDNACQVYNARWGTDMPDLLAFKNSVSSFRLEKKSAPPPTASDGVQMCDGTQWGGGCGTFTYTSNSTCIDLGPSGWDNRADSMRFMGSYVSGYEVIMYDDRGCTVTNARYGQDIADLGAYKNAISSIRIENTGAPAGPNDGVELCDGTNYGSPCQPFYRTSDSACINLQPYGWDNRAESVRFRSGYAGGYEIIVYHDSACQIYNARYGQDIADMNAFRNQIASIRIEKKSPPAPDLYPNPLPGRSDPIVVSNIPNQKGDTLYTGQPLYISWGYQNSGPANVGFHYVDVWIDDQRLIHYPFSGLCAGCQGGFSDWRETWHSAGWHTIKIVVDPDSQVNERDKSNNTWSKDFYFSAGETCAQCGLSVGAWSMVNHDLLHTGRSEYVGPLHPQLIRKQLLGHDSFSSPVIGPYGIIYLSMDQSLIAFDPNGDELWRFTAGGGIHTPLITSDGVLYAGSSDGNLYALGLDGTQKWKFTTGGWIGAVPAVAIDGTIYIGSSDGEFYAINPDGSQKWRYHVGSWINSSPAVAPDGTIYFGSTNSIIYALGPAGNLKWSYQTGSFVDEAPAIGADGTVYIGGCDRNFYAFTPDGQVKWKLTMGGAFSGYAPALGLDGTIYVGNQDHTLYAIHPDGSIAWRFTTGYDINASPAVDHQGNIYIGSHDGSLYALRPNGSLIWQDITHGWMDGGPALAPNGLLYVSDTGGTFYIYQDQPRIFLPIITR